MATEAPDYPVEDVLAYGQKNGYSPEETASAVQQWRQQSLDYGDEVSSPEDFLKGETALNQITKGALDTLRQQSNAPEHPVFDVPHGAAPVPIEHNGQVLANFQPRQRADGSLSLLMMVPDGETGKPLYDRLHIPAVTQDDIVSAAKHAALEKAKYTSQADDADAADAMAMANGFMPKVGDNGLRQKAADAATRAALLSDPDHARALLTSERAAEALRQSPLASKVGQGGIVPLMQNFATAVNALPYHLAATALDVMGDTEGRDRVLKKFQDLQTIMPGDTRGAFRGGLAAVPGKAASLAGSFAPVIATSPLAPASTLTMGLQSGSDADVRALELADQLDQQAKALRASRDDAIAQQLEQHAQEVRSNRGAYAAASAALMAAGGSAIPKLAEGAGVLKAAARGGAEMTGLMGVQGQVLDPLALGEDQRMSAGETLEQAALGAALGGVHAGLDKPAAAKRAAEHAEAAKTLADQMRTQDAAAATATEAAKAAGGDTVDQHVAGLRAITEPQIEPGAEIKPGEEPVFAAEPVPDESAIENETAPASTASEMGAPVTEAAGSTPAGTPPLDHIQNWAEKTYGDSAVVTRGGHQYSVSFRRPDGTLEYVTPAGGSNVRELESLGYNPRADESALPLSFSKDSTIASVAAPRVGVSDHAARNAMDLLGQSEVGRSLSKGVLMLRNAGEMLAHPDFAGRKFTRADLEALHSGAVEGFHDARSGKTVVLADHVGVREGETSAQAVARVILHEKVAHEGLDFLRRTSPTFARDWQAIKDLIPHDELAEVERDYPELSGNHDALAEEWLARQAEKLKPDELPTKGSALDRAWQAVKDYMRRLWLNSRFARGEAFEKSLDGRVRDLFASVLEGHKNAENRADALDRPPSHVRFSYERVPDSLMGFRREGPNQSFEESKYPHVQAVELSFDGGQTWDWDAIKGLNQEHALERARRNWPGATIRPLKEMPREIRMSKLGDYWNRTKEEWRKLGEIPKFTDTKKAAQKWQGGMQRVVAKVEAIVHELKSTVKDPLRREAITNWIEADGDAKVLRDRANKSTGATEKFKRGYEAALNLTPEELKLARKVRDIFNSEGQHFQSKGVLKGWLDNYVNHVWRFEDSSGSKRGRIAQFSAQVTQNFSHAGKRKLGSFFEGEQKGLQPGTKDVADLLGSYILEGHKAILGRQLKADLLKGRASDGSNEPLAYLSGHATTKEEANGDPGPILVDPNARAKKLKMGMDANGNPLTADGKKYEALPELGGLRSFKWVEKGADGQPVFSKGDLLLHPEAFKYLKPAFGRDRVMDFLRRESDNLALTAAKKLGLGVIKGQSIAKQFLFGWGFFHVVQEGTHAIGHLVNPFAKLERFDPDSAEHTFMVDHGLMLGHDSISRRQWEEGLGAGGTIIEKIPGLGHAAKWLSDFTFNGFIPSLKIKTYRAALARNLERYASDLASGRITQDDIGYLTGKEVNQAYGHLNKMDTGWGRSTQRIMSLGMLAPDFLEARARFAIGAINDLGHGRLSSEQAMALGVLAGTFYTAARVLNALMNDGDAKWDPKYAFAFVHNNRIWSMRSVPEDILALIEDPRKFVHGRIAPYMQTLQDLYTGKNYRGEPMTAARAFEETILRHIPIALRWAADYGGKKLTDAYPVLKNVPLVHGLSDSGNRAPVNPWQQFVGTVGLHASRYSPITDTQRLATKWREANDPTYKAEGSYPISVYQKLKYALEDGDMNRATTEYKALLQQTADQKLVGALNDHTPGNGGAEAKLFRGFHTSLFRPYTSGSKATEAAWVKSLTDGDKALKSLADDRRKEVWSRFEVIRNANR